MTHPRQLALLVTEEAADRESESGLVEVMRATLHALTPKEVAFRAGTSASDLSHSFSRRDGRRIPVEWLALLVRMDPERRVLRYLADLADCDIVERDRRTDAEKLGAAVEQLESLGEVGLVLLKKAGLR